MPEKVKKCAGVARGPRLLLYVCRPLCVWVAVDGGKLAQEIVRPVPVVADAVPETQVRRPGGDVIAGQHAVDVEERHVAQVTVALEEIPSEKLAHQFDRLYVVFREETAVAYSLLRGAVTRQRLGHEAHLLEHEANPRPDVGHVPIYGHPGRRHVGQAVGQRVAGVDARLVKVMERKGLEMLAPVVVEALPGQEARLIVEVVVEPVVGERQVIELVAPGEPLPAHVHGPIRVVDDCEHGLPRGDHVLFLAR